MKIKVENMVGVSGKAIANQFVIQTDDGLYFQSYNSIIAFKPLVGRIQLDINKWDCSQTTGRYRNIFLDQNKAETQQYIDEGVYELVDLN